MDSLTPAQVKAYIIADNRMAEDAGWDEQILKIEFQNLILEDEIDISPTGFEIPEIDIVLQAGTEEQKNDPDDYLPEETQESYRPL